MTIFGDKETIAILAFDSLSWLEQAEQWFLEFPEYANSWECLFNAAEAGEI